jgi:mono/diheme cytochrome c family protein
MVEGHTDAQLFDWLSNGVPDTAMQGFADQLSVEDRWNVLNYLQTFAPAAQ